MNSFFAETVRLGLRNLRLHKLRSALTALGIIFGVGAVICMLSISEGASADEMRLIELLGTRNIIVQSIRPQQATQVAESRNTRMLEYGVLRDDVEIIRNTLPHIVEVIPMRDVAFAVRRGETRAPAAVVGTTPTLFEHVNLNILPGGRALSDLDNKTLAQVCVIGDEIAKVLFPLTDPIGQTLLAQTDSGGNSIPYEVVGVLGRVKTAGAPGRSTQERDFNKDVYIPIATANARYGDKMVRQSSGTREWLDVELSGLYIVIDQIENVERVSDLVRRVFEKTHDKDDFDIRVPLASLEQAQRKKRNQQLVLGIIAAVSLLVGGIGIMNIMLATVTERTKEIGIRRALGAKRHHIVWQFLVETVVLTTIGGLIGIALGWGGARVINELVQWETIVHTWTVMVSFCLSVLIGIFFGMYPAIRASRLDPIVALRYE
ncbi:MAG: Macrolide export ATP-binding/permease protein MacB [Phycisphaerae bacterium]|nr:Macrolide export ATP-binding/permease protein MacB [Phycisphaerae bacterium]